jgi:hypothetical protein
VAGEPFEQWLRASCALLAARHLRASWLPAVTSRCTGVDPVDTSLDEDVEVYKAACERFEEAHQPDNLPYQGLVCPVVFENSRGQKREALAEGFVLKGSTCTLERTDGERPGPARGEPGAAEAAPASPSSRRPATAPPTKVVRRSRPVFVELFSGMATLTAAAAAVGFTVESWDIKLGPQHDLLVEPSRPSC